jgi:hypothetical protein
MAGVVAIRLRAPHPGVAYPRRLLPPNGQRILALLAPLILGTSLILGAVAARVRLFDLMHGLTWKVIISSAFVLTAAQGIGSYVFFSDGRFLPNRLALT